MTRQITPLLVLLVGINPHFREATATEIGVANNSTPTTQTMNLMPLTFTQNQGQWNEKALYRANAGGAAFWFSNDKVYYQFFRRISKDIGMDTYALCRLPEQLDRFNHEDDSVSTISFSATFVGSNSSPEVIGEDLMEYKCNYFIGNDPTKWHTDVPNYRAVVYKDIYPGVDLKYYGSGDGKLEYDFIIQPGADPSQIAIRYDGAQGVCVNDKGELSVETRWGEVTEGAPQVYQLINGERKDIKSEYCVRGENTFGFRLQEEYVPEFAITVDPQLSYSTYLGGHVEDDANGIAVDGSGHAFVCGRTESTDFPTQNAFQPTDQPGIDDCFITKLNGSGNALVYSTYFGGNGSEGANGIAVDSNGNAYFTGYTTSTDFPTQNPFQAINTDFNSSVFVTKLSSTGNSLIYSTYLGGNYEDRGRAIAIDKEGNAYVTGETYSSNFPTQNPFQSTHKGTCYNAFVTKFNSAGNGLIYSTFLGGDSDYAGGVSCDIGYGIAVNDSGNAYVTGLAQSTDFPTQNPLQPTYGGDGSGRGDAFVTQFSSLGNTLVYSTYLGGSDREQGYGIAIDGSGNVYVVGQTWSRNFPTQNAYQGTSPVWSTNGFVSKLNRAGSGLIFSTYLGGNTNQSSCQAIAVNSAGCAYVTGYTLASDFPIKNPFQGTISAVGDAFVTKFNSVGNQLIFSTFLGGSNGAGGEGIAIDSSDNVYVTGTTRSTDFPTLNPCQSTYHGVQDAFVTKFSGFVCSDANADGLVNISDVVFLISYIFSSGSSPYPLLSGDANCDHNVNISDAVYLIAYIFGGGPAPCAACK